jgi:hypothetical protein
MSPFVFPFVFPRPFVFAVVCPTQLRQRCRGGIRMRQRRKLTVRLIAKRRRGDGGQRTDIRSARPRECADTAVGLVSDPHLQRSAIRRLSHTRRPIQVVNAIGETICICPHRQRQRIQESVVRIAVRKGLCRTRRSRARSSSDDRRIAEEERLRRTRDPAQIIICARPRRERRTAPATSLIDTVSPAESRIVVIVRSGDDRLVSPGAYHVSTFESAVWKNKETKLFFNSRLRYPK